MSYLDDMLPAGSLRQLQISSDLQIYRDKRESKRNSHLQPCGGGTANQGKPLTAGWGGSLRVRKRGSAAGGKELGVKRALHFVCTGPYCLSLVPLFAADL